MAFERIGAGDTKDATTEAMDLEGFAGAVVYDQNEYNREENEDVFGILEENGAVVVTTVDGVSKSRKPEHTNFDYESLAVSRAFAECFLSHVKPLLAARQLPSLAQAHQIAADHINHGYMNGDLPKGGLVVVSALLLPDGQLFSHRVGDPEALLSRVNPEGLELPPEWYPQNFALKDYLAYCIENKIEPNLDRDFEWAARVLTGKGNDRVVNHHISSVTPFQLPEGAKDFNTSLAPQEGVLLATDGLKVFRNKTHLAGQIDWRTAPPEEVLHAIHTLALRNSADNMTGVFLRRKAS